MGKGAKIVNAFEDLPPQPGLRFGRPGAGLLPRAAGAELSPAEAAEQVSRGQVKAGRAAAGLGRRRRTADPGPAFAPAAGGADPVLAGAVGIRPALTGREGRLRPGSRPGFGLGFGLRGRGRRVTAAAGTVKHQGFLLGKGYVRPRSGGRPSRDRKDRGQDGVDRPAPSGRRDHAGSKKINGERPPPCCLRPFRRKNAPSKN